MAKKPLYTQNELRRFDLLTAKLSSLDQMVRINARFDVSAFIKEHGEEKCDAMFAVLKKRDAKKGIF